MYIHNNIQPFSLLFAFPVEYGERGGWWSEGAVSTDFAGSCHTSYVCKYVALAAKSAEIASLYHPPCSTKKNNTEFEQKLNPLYVHASPSAYRQHHLSTLPICKKLVEMVYAKVAFRFYATYVLPSVK